MATERFVQQLVQVNNKLELELKNDLFDKKYTHASYKHIESGTDGGETLTSYNKYHFRESPRI